MSSSVDPVLALAIELPASGGRGVLQSLHGQLRAAILEGRLQPGLKLPSTRALAATLGVSRNTAVAAYDLLLAEGYVRARPGAGNFVAETLRRNVEPSVDAARVRRLAAPWRSPPAMSAPLPPPRFDFGVGLPDVGAFPFEVWRRLMARSLRALARQPPGVAPAEGRPALRAAIAGHVSFARAVACDADDVVVTAGAQQAFDLLARVLVTPGRTVVAVEEPGYPPARHAFAMAGARVVPVPVDAEGLCVQRLPERAAVVVVTPSHQFPTGVVLSPRRRAALLAFARRRQAVIVEDDYDAEFRYGGRPLDALQTMDADAVCYVGTFSKSLFPALRLGYAVAPAWLRPALVAARALTDRHGDVAVQDTLAAFIGEGHLGRHLRRMRRIYAERRAILLAALQRHGGARIELLPSAAGLHVAARWRGVPDPLEVVRRARASGVGVEDVARYASGAAGQALLAFGFGGIDTSEVERGVRTWLAAID